MVTLVTVVTLVTAAGLSHRARGASDTHCNRDRQVANCNDSLINWPHLYECQEQRRLLQRIPEPSAVCAEGVEIVIGVVWNFLV